VHLNNKTAINMKLSAYIVARKIYLCHLFSTSHVLDWPKLQLHNLYFYTVKEEYSVKHSNKRMYLNVMH